MATQMLERDQTYRRQFGDKLGGGADRAKWIDSVDQHADKDGQTLITVDHDVIMQWAEQRNAQPATVAGTEHDNRPGVLRFDFPGGSEGKLKAISWDEWFRTFDARDVALIYQEKTAGGRQSNFARFISPHHSKGLR